MANPQEMKVFDSDLVCPRLLILDHTPGLAIIAVRHLEGGDKLHHSKVFCSLSNNSGHPFRCLHVHL